MFLKKDPTVNRKQIPRRRLRQLLTSIRVLFARSLPLITVFFMTISLVGWAFASPVGGSPDDDYHLPSIWCPSGGASGECLTRMVNDKVEVAVPEPIARASLCYAMQAKKSAECTLSFADDVTAYTARVDHGDYPPGFYDIHHLFAVDSAINASVLWMRVFNVLVAVLGVTAVIALSSRAQRSEILMALMLAWMPMGVYFLASNNPTSWSLSGIAIFAGALFSAAQADGKKQWLLSALAAFGALVACSSRADAAFYCFVVAVAFYARVPLSKKRITPFVVSSVAGIIGVIIMRSSGQSGTIGVSQVDYGVPFRRLVMSNIISLPEYFAGFYGREWGPGWFDVPLQATATIGSLLVVGAGLFIGARSLDLRKTLSAVVLVGALAGIPVVMMVSQGYLKAYVYQPRYLLPLLAVFFMVWVSSTDRQALHLTSGQKVFFAGLLSAVNAVALHSLMRRYVTGIDIPSYDLNFQKEWWWSLPITPMAWWMFSSVAFFVAITCALHLIFMSQEKEKSHARFDES